MRSLASLVAVLGLIVLAAGCGTRNLAEFKTFDARCYPGYCAPHDYVAHAVVQRTSENTYRLTLKKVIWSSSDRTERTTERDLSDKEVAELRRILSAVPVRYVVSTPLQFVTDIGSVDYQWDSL